MEGVINTHPTSENAKAKDHDQDRVVDGRIMLK